MSPVCRKCGQEKSVEEFIKDRKTKDGLSFCHSCHAARVSQWRHTHIDIVRAQSRVGYRRHMEERQAHGRIGHQERKVRVLTHYGNGKLACVRCGFTNIKALSIDHINGGGKAHRASLGIAGGSQFYCWLERQGFPEGYQTLCMNCQYIKKLEVVH